LEGNRIDGKSDTTTSGPNLAEHAKIFLGARGAAQAFLEMGETDIAI
jgi:hypothetical protein